VRKAGSESYGGRIRGRRSAWAQRGRSSGPCAQLWFRVGLTPWADRDRTGRRCCVARPLRSRRGFSRGSVPARPRRRFTSASWNSLPPWPVSQLVQRRGDRRSRRDTRAPFSPVAPSRRRVAAGEPTPPCTRADREGRRRLYRVATGHFYALDEVTERVLWEFLGTTGHYTCKNRGITSTPPSAVTRAGAARGRYVGGGTDHLYRAQVE